jgi:hypothetical protein
MAKRDDCLRVNQGAHGQSLSANNKAWYRQKLAQWKGHQCPLMGLVV